MRPTLDINFLAIIVSVVASMFIGAMWYGPLFGKPWMKEMGYTEEELKKNFNPAKTYGLTFLGQLAIAFVLSFLIDYVSAAGLRGAIFTGFFTWLGFTAAPMFINFQFSQKSVKLFIIDSFHFLTVIMVMSIILTLWV